MKSRVSERIVTGSSTFTGRERCERFGENWRRERDSCRVAARAARWPEGRSLRQLSEAKIGGERGIRTPGAVSDTVVFKTTALNHSAISPSVSCHAKE